MQLQAPQQAAVAVEELVAVAEPVHLPRVQPGLGAQEVVQVP